MHTPTPYLRLLGFAAVLGLVFAGAAVAGGATGVERSTPAPREGHGGEGMAMAADPVRGLAVSDGGLTLELTRRGDALALRIADARGRTVRDFDVEHARRMHLIVVRRDMTAFQHLHPRQAADGTWSVPVRLAEAGTYRVLADFSVGGRPQTLATDLAVDGDVATTPLPAPQPTARADGMQVRLDERPPGPPAPARSPSSASPSRGAGDRSRCRTTWVPRATSSRCARATSPSCTSTRTSAACASRRRSPRPVATACSCSSRWTAACTPPRSSTRSGDDRPRRPADHRHDLRSCANRVERGLNRLDGVTATVNYATERAAVVFDPDAVAPEQLVAAVEAAGYEAALPGAAEEPRDADEGDPLLRRLARVGAALAAAAAISMIPALQFDNWQWLALNLATPVVLWGAWPLHRAAWANLRHGTATMDTLVSVGVLAAWLWSLYALFLGDAGTTGMRMELRLVPQPGGSDEIYLETAAIVTTFILAGRWFEARAKRRAGGALRALLGAGCEGRRGPRGRRRRATRPRRAARRGRPLRRAPGREGRDRRRRRGGDLGGRHEHADG